MLSPKHNSYLSYNKSSCHFWLSCITVVSTSSPWVSSCTKILLTLRMRPAPIALNYSVKHIQNDVRQKIVHIYIYIWKIAIQHTSVGLAHACPNYTLCSTLWHYFWYKIVLKACFQFYGSFWLVQGSESFLVSFSALVSVSGLLLLTHGLSMSQRTWTITVL